jgi:hypothetical protein
VKRIPAAVRKKIRVEARNRCGYCQARQDLSPATFEVEHIIPVAAGGTSEENNLWLSCSSCNGHKGTQVKTQDPKSGRSVALFNPRRQKWSRHFRWSEDGTRIIGSTACGRATVKALKLNNETLVTVRKYWVQWGEHPPPE